MKKNFLHFYILAVVLFAASAFTSCSNNDEQASVLPVNTYTITVNATKGDDVSSAPSNRALSFVGPTLTATWTKDDVVAVYKSETHLGDLTAQSSGTSTTLSGTLTGSVLAGDELTLKFLSPNYTSQEGTLDYIAANCDYATATVTVSSIDGGNITTTAANFTNQQAIVKFTLKDKANDNDLSATQLVVTADGTSYTVTPTSATNVLYVAVPGIASKNVTLTAKVGTTTYSFVNSSATFVNGKYYTVSVKMALVKTLANATADDIGKIVGTDGKIYNSTSEATNPAAMIAYISSPGNGLAIALTDDASDSFTDAGKNAAAHTPTVTTFNWKMPSRTDWENMFTACGISGDGEDNYNHGNWTNKGFRDKLKACGADILTDNTYWTSNDLGNGTAYIVIFSGTQSCSFQSDDKGTTLKVRAVLEF